MLKVKDVMTKNVICVKKDTPITEALEYLERHNISGLPVVEDDMILVGVLSEKDILKFYYEEIDLKDKTVAEYMTHPAISFDEEDDLLGVCTCLENHFIRRLPVTKNGKLTGIVSRRDIIKYILWTKCEKIIPNQSI
ncbi:MAG: CBS domain-containing protein [Planctomycetota bacterium]|jgi:CBS domain-containing protein